jgi:(E)-4-hydroxy-3-methylbut-2-enyl-diphosphate synthase
VSFDVETVARKVRRATRDIQKPLTVAVMGCVVNGPGEARQADIGICGAPGGCAIFMGDQVIRVSAENALEELLTRVRLLADA